MMMFKKELKKMDEIMRWRYEKSEEICPKCGVKMYRDKYYTLKNSYRCLNCGAILMSKKMDENIKEIINNDKNYSTDYYIDFSKDKSKKAYIHVVSIKKVKEFFRKHPNLKEKSRIIERTITYKQITLD